MEYKKIVIGERKKIALIAHDNKKHDLIEWAKFNKLLLSEHELYATGTTGLLLEEVLGISITRFQSGPLGGDLEIGASIAEGRIDFVIFFWDPLEPQPHDPDVRGILEPVRPGRMVPGRKGLPVVGLQHLRIGAAEGGF